MVVQKRQDARDKKARASAQEANLRYVSNRMPGIERVRAGPRFRYVSAGGGKVTPSDVKRIRALVIPPAWENVWICPLANGHLQATGRDAKGRKQYRYHAQWHTVRTQTNFHRMIQFAHALPAIRRRVARDLRQSGLPMEKVLAAVVSLLEHTHIRVGNAEYAEENQSFGLSTMRDRHVEVRGDIMKFRFRGKSGKFHSIDLDNARLARVVKHCQDLPGYEVFQYLDDAGEVRNVTSEHVNDYLRTIAGDNFTAKDFRTWAGTSLAMEFLHCKVVDEKPTESALIKACDAVAAELGNTRSVCRKHYIHPAVPAAYLDGSLSKWFEDESSSGSSKGLRSDERAVLRLLKHWASKQSSA